MKARIRCVLLAVVIFSGSLFHAHAALAASEADRMRTLIRKHFSHDVRWALRVAWCESRLNPRARHRNRNGTIDYGLFQINSGGTLQSLGLTPRSALDPISNIKAAVRLHRQRGRKPWSCK